CFRESVGLSGQGCFNLIGDGGFHRIPFSHVRARGTGIWRLVTNCRNLGHRGGPLSGFFTHLFAGATAMPPSFTYRRTHDDSVGKIYRYSSLGTGSGARPRCGSASKRVVGILYTPPYAI